MIEIKLQIKVIKHELSMGGPLDFNFLNVTSTVSIQEG